MNWVAIEMVGEIATGLGSDISIYSWPYNPVFGDDHPYNPNLTLNPVVGETSDPALALAGEMNLVRKVEAIYEEPFVMANETKQQFTAVKVPAIMSPSDDEKQKALAELKAGDPGQENDLFPTSIRKGPYKLFVIRARDAVKDQKGRPVIETDANGAKVKKMRIVQGFIFLPGAESATLDEMVSWFAQKKWGDTSPEALAAAFTEFKEKAIAAELIAHRSKMKSVPSGAGKKRGKTRF